MGENQKRYASVTDMVRDLCDPEFADAFERQQDLTALKAAVAKLAEILRQVTAELRPVLTKAYDCECDDIARQFRETEEDAK